MDSTRNERWTISFKKFNMIKVNEELFNLSNYIFDFRFIYSCIVFEV